MILPDNVESQVQCKVVILGDSSVGKTATINQYVNQTFATNLKSTIGADFYSKTDTFDDGQTLDFLIWDTAGQERFHSVSSVFYRGTNACILMFDLTNHQSFERLDFWRDAMLNNTSATNVELLPFLVFANKADLEPDRAVTKAEIEQYSKQHNITVLEVSALTGQNITKGFHQIGEMFLKVKDKIFQNLVGIQVDHNNDQNNQKKKGCC